MFGIILLLSAFLVCPAFAENTTPKINSEYLNELTSDNVTWNVATEEEASSGYDIVLINGAYYRYTYNNSGEYTETSTRLNNNLSETNTQSVVFKNIANTSDSADVSGGAIYNTNRFNNPIIADFFGNHALTTKSNNYAQGGAIYNRGTIGDITGNFIGNYVKETEYASSSIGGARGGAIFNEGGTIGNIIGNFIDNYAQASAREGGCTWWCYL